MLIILGVLALMIFSLICFLKYKVLRPNYVCSCIFATTISLNILCGWAGLDFLQENKASVVLLVRPEFTLISINGP